MADTDADVVRDNALQSILKMCQKITAVLSSPLGKTGDLDTGL